MVPVEKMVSLYPHFCNVKEALAMLENMCKQLRKHIYTAHMQWNAHIQQINKLTVAMYPTCIEFKAADGRIAKGVKTFLSEDKEYSHQ